MPKWETVCGVLHLLAVLSQLISASEPSGIEEETYIRFDTKDTYTAAAGSSFIVKCQSNVLIKLVRRSTKNTTTADNDDYFIEDNDGRVYTAQQTLTDLTYKDVGWFDCLDLSPYRPKTVAFYLFVDDPAHLMAKPRVTRISAASGESVIIPCIPTAPDVSVNLLTSSDEIIGSSTNPKDEDTNTLLYHPAIGFLLPPRMLIIGLWFVYKCEFAKRGVKQHNYVDVVLDGGGVDFVFLKRQAGIETINAKPDTDIILIAEVFTSYKPTILWYDPYDREIKTDKKFTVGHILGEPWETRLIIHNVSSTDAGYYTVRAVNAKEMSFKLQVGVVQTLDIEMEKVFLVSDHNFIAFCRETPPRPIRKLTWTFRRHNCKLQKCEETVSSLKTHQNVDDIEFNPKLPHAILFNKPMLANITCAMEYNDGTKANVTRPLIVSEAKDGFEIQHKYDKYFSDKTVALTCTVSRFLYSDHLYWIGHNGFVIEKNRTKDRRNMTVTRSETDYSYRVTLTIQMDAEYLPPDEVYRCMAVDYQHQPSFMPHELNLHTGVAPHFFGSDMSNDSQLVMVGEHLTLTCYVGGRPYPTLHWYKDDMKIGTDGHHNLELHLQMNDTGRYSCRVANDYGEVYLFTDLVVYYPVNVTANDTDAADGWSLEGRVSERVTLLCSDDSEPAYNSNWFRDDAKVFESSSITIRDNGTILSIFPVKAQDSGFYTCGQSHAEDSSSIVATLLGTILAIVLVFAVIYLGFRVRHLKTLGTPISYRNLLSKRI